MFNETRTRIQRELVFPVEGIYTYLPVDTDWFGRHKGSLLAVPAFIYLANIDSDVKPLNSSGIVAVEVILCDSECSCSSIKNQTSQPGVNPGVEVRILINERFRGAFELYFFFRPSQEAGFLQYPYFYTQSSLLDVFPMRWILGIGIFYAIGFVVGLILAVYYMFSLCFNYSCFRNIHEPMVLMGIASMSLIGCSLVVAPLAFFQALRKREWPEPESRDKVLFWSAIQFLIISSTSLIFFLVIPILVYNDWNPSRHISWVSYSYSSEFKTPASWLFRTMLFSVEVWWLLLVICGVNIATSIPSRSTIQIRQLKQTPTLNQPASRPEAVDQEVMEENPYFQPIQRPQPSVPTNPALKQMQARADALHSTPPDDFN